MSDSPLDKLPAHDRVSIRAVLVHEGEDASAALANAGFAETISVPVVLGEQPDLSGGILGNGITPNVTAVLETARDQASDALPGIQPGVARPEREDVRLSVLATTMLPAAFGMQPLAPVRGTGGAEGGPALTTDHSDDSGMVDRPPPDRFTQTDFRGTADGTKPSADAEDGRTIMKGRSGGIANWNGGASPLRDKHDTSNLLTPVNATVIVPGPPAILPPVFMPGTPANDDIVKSMIEGFRAIQDATANIFNAKASNTSRR